jgi:hypothetical protein
MPVRLKIACISACIDTSLRCPRAHVAAVVVRPVVVVAARDGLDEGRAGCEARRALRGRVGAPREVELRRLAHFWLVSVVRYGFPAESQCLLGGGSL